MRIVLAAALALMLAACGPRLPDGVSKETLDGAVARAIGDPNTCVLIADAKSGRQIYRYNDHAACDAKLPACETPETRDTGALLEAVARDGRPRRLSCNTVADASRGVGWAAGPVPGRPLVYAAVMEGDRAFPGLMMADRLERAFKRAGF
ncbi:hypothetical protein [Phenylobacterium immobile]|uniref:hypothetical protein n=1 Tax=Phenylobacterium immobile TaxID=21 RepID=UPI000A9811DC|nr:hypothetical protein [Phenylobacterium immobile]